MSHSSFSRWLSSFPEAEHSVYSQNGEDGVIQHLLSFVGVGGQRSYVEFGTEDGMQVNTRLLREAHGWSGVLMDGGYENASIGLIRTMITEANIVALLQRFGVPHPELGLLSVDTDCFDFWITRAILEAGYRPRILINEVNAALAPYKALSVPHRLDPRAGPNGGNHSMCWGSSTRHDDRPTRWFGASVGAFVKLNIRFGYSMVYCESVGINCFSVRNDLLPHTAARAGGGGANSAGVAASGLVSTRLLNNSTALHRPPRYGLLKDACTHKFDLLQRPFVRVSASAGVAPLDSPTETQLHCPSARL